MNYFNGVCKKIVFILVLMMAKNSNLPAQTIFKIEAAQAYKIYTKLDNKNFCIIDCRDSASFCREHVKNAVNIDVYTADDLLTLPKYLNMSIIVVYCTMNKRSEILIEKLAALRYDGVIIDIIDGFDGLKRMGFEANAGN